MAVVLAVVGTGIVWEAGAAQAASFTSPPTRLYMAPDGTTLFAGLLGVPIGTLEFGPGPNVDDVISGDSKDITVAVDEGPLGCDTINDKPIGVLDYDLDDCPNIVVDVIHGRLKLEQADQLFRDYLTDPDGDGPLVAGSENENDVVWRLPGGAIVSQIGGGGDPDTPNDPDGHTLYRLHGLEGQINSALDGMSYVPDDGYYFTNSDPEERLAMLLASGDPSVSSSSHSVEIRVLDVNDAASLEGPASATAQPEVELFLPEAAPGLQWPYAGSLWTVADDDNDEVVDDDDGETLPDGAGDKMLLVTYLDCGVPTVDGQTGFRLRGGSFEADAIDIEDLLTDFFQLTTAPTEVQDAVDLLLDALNAIEPGLTTIPLATNDPFVYDSIFAGIGDIDDVAYALSQPRFLTNAESDTCTLYTVVSDLGNNGLPLQYIGDPPTGVEVPWLGIPPIDIVETEITVGGLVPIEVGFDPATQFVAEGTTATATIEIVVDPPGHPEFDLRVSTVDGTANAGADYQGVSPYATVTVPEDATSVTFDTNVFNDGPGAEGNETFLFSLTVPTDPPDSPGGFDRPFGYEVVATQSTQTVVILDDDDPAAQVDSFTGEDVLEGDSGTTTMTFTIELDKPADGTESVDVAVTGGTAANPSDFGDPVPTTVTFASGATTATIDVPVVGDTTDEDDETIELTLSNPSNVTLPPGDASAVGTILDDDETRVASIADASVIEGDAGTVDLVFTVSLDQPAKGTESLTVSTSDGAPGAVAPGDYAALTNVPVTFAAGETSATVDVVVNGDTDIESDETFTIALSVVSNVALGDGSATGTITNDDGVIAVSVDDVTVVEGDAGTTNAVFTVSLAEEAVGNESITITTGDDTATDADDDYEPGTQNLSFAPTETSASFTVLVNGDTDVESDETFEVTLSSPVGLVIVDGTGVGTITNDDDPPDETAPTVTVNQAAGQADPTATSPILFTVVFSEPVTGFEASDVLLDGTAGPTSANVTGSGTTYTVAVSGMPGPGTVIVSVPAGAAVDAALNDSLASTSTDNVVTYEPDVGAPLTIDVPDDIVRGNDPGEAGAVVDFEPATASGGTPPTAVTCDRSSREFFPLGTTTVNCTATDSENDQLDERFVEATVTASFTITVVDTEPPVIADNPDIVRGATSSSGTTVTFPLPAATDNAGTPTVTCTPPSGTQFRIGVSTVTCTATDGAGNTASSSFRITVTSPGSGVPVTGSDTAAVLLIAGLFLLAGISSRRIARRA